MVHKKGHLKKDFSIENQMLIFGFLIITLGFYGIYWFFLKNREFEHLDDFAPDSNRGFILMSILPLGWFFISQLLSFLFGSFSLSSIFTFLNYLIWFFILFLILKYIFDFCMSFGRITRTNGLIWSIPFFISFGSLYLFYILRINFLLFFLIMYFIMIPSMQLELNKFYLNLSYKRDKHLFYH